MKVRLNKKTKEELSTNQVLGTLQTKQKQVEEDITTYIDEPFLKPENIRHGITMAGVDGKYAEVKYLNIYDLEGNHLRTLASTEPTPTLKYENGNIILTNKPFEDQVIYNVGNVNVLIQPSANNDYIEVTTLEPFTWTTDSTKDITVIVVPITEIQEIPGTYSVVKLNGDKYGVEFASDRDDYTGFYVGEIGDWFNQSTMGDIATSIYWQGAPDTNGIHEICTYWSAPYDGGSGTNSKLGYFLNTPNFYNTTDSAVNSTYLTNLDIKVTTEELYDSYWVDNKSIKTTLELPKGINLLDENIGFNIDILSGNITAPTGYWGSYYNISKDYGSTDINVTHTPSWEISNESPDYARYYRFDVYKPSSLNSVKVVGCDVSDNKIEFALCCHYKPYAESDSQQWAEARTPDFITINLVDLNPSSALCAQQVNIEESTIDIPYYVELPTKAYELGFDEDVAIGETSRMLIQRNSNYMEYTQYLSKLESAAPGIYKRSNSIGGQDITVYETLSQRIIVQYLSYRYNADDISQVHEELRVIEDSRTGEFNRLAFSNTGQGPVEGYSEMPDDPVTFIMLSDNANSPSGHYATGDTYRWGGAMGFVFKLRDGKFFIIDGGIGGTNPAYTKYDSQAPILAAALKRYAPDPNNIKIAGWLLTHAHQDHVGVFCEFIENPEYKSIISIDKVIYSLPVEDFQCFQEAKSNQTYNEFNEALNVLRAEGKTELVKAHMGMEFGFGGLGLTILSAPENVYKSYYPGTEDPISDFDNINNTCIVSKVAYAGKRLIFMADACAVQIGAVIIPLVAEVFNMATALQVPHHGYADTQSYRLYNRIGQSTLENTLEFTIWPLCHEHFTGKQVNGEDYYEGGKKYNSIFAHSNNAALQNIRAIYPQNNWSVVANGTSWDFSYVDFIDPCTHHEWSNSICVNCGTSCTHSSGSGPSECIPNNDGTHTWVYYCAECRTHVLESYTYTSSCDYGGGDHCIICGAAAKPSEPCTHSSSNYTYHRDGDTTHSIYCNICKRDVDTRVSCDFNEDGYCVCGNEGCYICGDWADSGKCIKCGKIICGGSDCSVSNNDGTYTCKNCYDPSSVPSCHICGSTQLYNGGPAFGVVCENCGQGFCDDHWYGNSLSGKIYCSECGPSYDVAP